MSFRCTSEASASNVATGSTPPVGLCGEFRTSMRLRGVMRARSASMSMSKPRSATSGTGTTRAPRNSATDAYVGNAGLGISTSSPGSRIASMAKNSTGLAPGVTTTFAASHSSPRRAFHVRAISARNPGRPAGGP